MDCAVFGELPHDLVEKLLTFLPVPDLCRFRTVSKDWNELISDLKFAVSHAQNHANCRDPTFIVLHYISWTPNDSYGWCVLDMKARRWYRIEGSYRHRDVLFLEPDIPVAMDGGLVCQLLKTESEDQISLIVHNPIGNYFKILPPVPTHETAKECPGLSLVFDTIAKTFQAFVINHRYNKTSELEDPTTSEEERLRIRNDPAVRVYDSAANEWQSLRNPDWDISVVGTLLTSVIFQDHLVVVFYNPDQLWTYSIADRTWNRLTQPEFLDDIYTYEHTKLVVSANRLFLVSRVEEYWISLEEIKIPEMTLEWVCDLWKEEDIISWDDIPTGIPNDPTMGELDHGISVIGFGNSSLMVMLNSSGRCKVFDVVTHSWNADDLPHNPMTRLLHDECLEWAGMHMNLLLPNWELSTH